MIALANAHGYDLTSTDSVMVLSLGGGTIMDLVIGKLDHQVVYVGHYRQMDGEEVHDPIMWFWEEPAWFREEPARWVPFKLEQLRPPLQPYSPEEMAEFAEAWAAQLETRWASSKVQRVH